MSLQRKGHNEVHRSKVDSIPSVFGRAREGSAYQRLLIGASCFFFYVGCYCVNSVLPLHIRALKGSAMAVGTIMAAIHETALVARWVTGAAHARYGSKALMAGSALCLVFAALWYRFVGILPLLVIGASLQGIALGVFATAAVAQVLSGADSETARMSALSSYSVAHLSAGAVAPGLALTMASRIETGAVIALAAAAGIVALLPVIGLRAASRNGERINGIASTVAGAVRDRLFLGASVLYFAWAISYASVYSFLSLFGAERGILNVGVFFALYATINLLGRLFVGSLASRFGAGLLVNASTVLVISSMCLLSVTRSAFVLGLAGTVYGLGTFSLYPCLASVAAGRVSRALGIGVALFMSNFELGQIAGSVGMANVAGALGYPAVYKAAALVLCLALVGYNVLGRKRGSGQQAGLGSPVL